MDENQNEQNAIKDVKEKKAKVPKVHSDKAVIITLIVAVLLIAFGLFGLFYYKTNMEAIVTFDGGKVTKSDYAVYYKLWSSYLSYYGYPSDQIAQVVANEAGLNQILYTKAKAAGLTLTDDEKKAVEAQYTDDDIKQLTSQGLDPEKVKQLVGYNYKFINKYLAKLESEVSTDDMLAYLKKTYGDNEDLNEYVTQDILFKITKTDSKTGSSTPMNDTEKATQKTKADAILQKALAGEDFATLAKSNSEDSTTSVNGGEYKMYMDGKTETAYSDAVKTLKAGEVYSKVVESTSGYHIIKLVSINANGRTNSNTEREAYVNGNLTSYETDANMKINTNVLNKTIKAITGNDIASSNNAVDSNNTTTNNTVSNDTATNNTAQ